MTVALCVIAALAIVAGLSLYVNWRQARTNGMMKAENATLRATLKQKEAQLVLYANARPGAGGAALESGTL